MTSLPILRLLILSAGMLASAAQASLVTNGGFETGDLTGWTKLGPVASFGAVVGGASMQPQDGNFQMRLLSGGAANGLFQMLDTVVGETYSLSFWLSNSKDCGLCWLDVSWDGVGVFNSSSEAAFGYRQYTYQVQATSSSTRLQFYLANLGGPVFLDNVSVEPVAATGTVPEPTTMALTLLALLGAGAARRQRREPIAG